MQVEKTDVLIVGAGLAGLVAATELVASGKSVTIVEQEPESSLGGQAWWSFGGLFLVDSPEQRRLGVHDSLALAQQDWFGSAGFDRPEDYWPKRWAEAYLQFAAGEKRAWLHGLGVRFFPVVGWAERGGSLADGHGNSVPRFHVTWGTGPGVLHPFIRRLRTAVDEGRARVLFRHRVDALTVEGGRVVGVEGSVLAASSVPRGVASGRNTVGEFALRADAVVVASGGIGGDLDLIRRNWPERLGPAPERMLAGVPEHVDGRMLGISAGAGARLINQDRMWHYTEGIENWAPVWRRHGIRILPGPSSLWLDAGGRRLPAPLYPGFDTLATLEHIARSGHGHTWFVLTQAIIEKEFALSGSEQNPDLTGKDLKLLAQRIRPGAPGPVEAFKRHGSDFIVADELDSLLDGMQALEPESELDRDLVRRQLESRDRQLRNPVSKDGQIVALRSARRYLGDRLIRVAKPHRLLDPKAGPLIAVRLHLLTRKTLGGIETDLDARALGPDGSPVPGLYAVGEASGFGGGGMHGYRALEGTFLGGCLFTGLRAAQAIAKG